MRIGFPKLLSLIIPAYKQEKTIVRDVGNVIHELGKLGMPYEVIVVVDGVIDETFKRARTIKNKNLEVVGYKTNHGKGYAVRFGMAKSHGDVIGFMDAGGDISASSLSMMLEHMRWYNADIIVGSKRHPAAKVSYPYFRRLMSWVYQMICKLFFGLNLRDTQVGMKLYKREVLEDVLPRLIVKEFAFDIEILAVAHSLGYKRIYEAPVELDFSGASTITSVNFWQVIGRTLWDTLAIFYRLKMLHYYENLNKRRWRFDPELNFRVNLP